MSWTLQLPTGERQVLTDGQYVLGRDPGCSIVLTENSVSRHHAVVTVRGQHATVRDLGSTNGTSLAGRRLAPNVDEPAPADALLRLGEAVCRLSFGVRQGAETVGDTGPLRPFPAHGRGGKTEQQWVLPSRSPQPPVQPRPDARKEAVAPPAWGSLARHLRSPEWWLGGRQEAVAPPAGNAVEPARRADALPQNLVYARYAVAGVMILSLLMPWLRAGGLISVSYIKVVSEAMRFVDREPRLLLLLAPGVIAAFNLLSAFRPKKLVETGAAGLVAAGVIYYYLQSSVQLFGVPLDLTGTLATGYYTYVLAAGASLGIGIHARQKT